MKVKFKTQKKKKTLYFFYQRRVKIIFIGDIVQICCLSILADMQIIDGYGL